MWDGYIDLIRRGVILSARSCETGGVCGGITKMALGNNIGFSGEVDDSLFDHLWCSIVFESERELDGFRLLGYTQAAPSLSFVSKTKETSDCCESAPCSCMRKTQNPPTSLALDELRTAWESTLENVFPTKTEQHGSIPTIQNETRPSRRTAAAFMKPKAVLPVFPGTNCEYDTAAAIERAGGIAETVMIRNLTPEMLAESVTALDKAIKSAQMIVFPGGFSGGDEPDSSGKYIVSLFRNERLTDAIHSLLYDRDGLVLGICNGFQALIKLGLLPYGKISTMTENCPTLTFNRIGRHQSRYINTRVSSVISPWLSKCLPGEVYVQPVSHGEGRLAAPASLLEELKENGQVTFQYVDFDGTPSMDIAYNPNGSAWAIEGITSADGRILGKMGHTERYAKHVAKNIPGNKFLPLFEGGVGYF